MKRHSLAGALAVCILAPRAPAQTATAPMAAATPMTFEVASIRKSDLGRGVQGGCHGIDSVYTPGTQADAPPLGRCRITDARLSHMVGIAWGVTMQVLKTGPDWIQRGDERFNVEAKVENPTKTTEKQLLTMLQNLIVERFQMKYHVDATETTGFVLKVAKSGPKLRESTSDDSDISYGEVNKPVPGRPVTMKAQKVNMTELIRALSAFAGHGQGVDETGLKGNYDFTLKWDEDLGLATAAPGRDQPPPRDAAGPTLVKALRDQLGLQMESRKVAVSYFVIDSARRPSDN